MQPFWKIDWQFFKMLNIELPYDPAISFLGIYPREFRTYVKTKVCLEMFIETFFIIYKKWKQSK